MAFRSLWSWPLLAASLALIPMPARAAWQPNGAPVCLNPFSQGQPLIAGDGNGGSYVMWVDARNYAATDVDYYLQHLTAGGDLVPGWPVSGLPLCTAPGGQYRVDGSFVADGQGGVFATWWDGRRGTDYDIYVQRMGPTGTAAPGWPTDGVQVTYLPSWETYPNLVPDGAGGAFIAWLDERNRDYPANPTDIYAMHLLADGSRAPGWPENGLPVSTRSLGDGNPLLLADGTGGVIIAWSYGDLEVHDILAIRLSAAGEVAPGWVANGKSVCSAPRIRGNLHLVSDGAGGAYLAWEDYRTSPSGTPPDQLDPYSDIYAQRITGAGDIAPGWPSDGLPLCTLPFIQHDVNLAADGLGGCFVAWEDYRAYVPEYSDVYALRVRGDGTLAPGWTAQGTRVSNEYGFQLTPQVVADNMGGVYLLYNDYAEEGYKLAAQHLTGDGQLAPGWPSQGVRVVQLVGQQQEQQAMPDGLGGAIVVWSDGRDAITTGSADIYAQRIGANTPVPVLVSLVSAEAEVGLVRLKWFAADAASLGASVERRTETSEWERLGSIVPDGSGALVYEDRAVTPGARYAYRLAYPDGAGTAYTSETWVAVPAPRFALRRLSPNPSPGDALVTFSLVSAEPARLELFDIHGRLVHSREVGSAGAGTQSVQLDARGRLPAGVYTVRLRQGPHVATARAVIVR